VDDDRSRRIHAIIERARELPQHLRESFLLLECGADAELLNDVQRLLEQDDFPDDLMTERSWAPDLRGETIGTYTIMEQLGAGGMGVVYLAAQSAPLRRRVALKIIKRGMDTGEVISRFESERQALALMDHPNIAKVLDAGSTKEGRPYFVMEYIPGVSLIRYCEEHNLGLRQRLDLFIQVCRGVQHAHQKGVIHRDIKPSNILVTEVEGRPVPKIIDFGVARATGQNLTARTYFTQLGRMIGTPEYMSPEQADPACSDIDTRTDVFSLGVVLYELLTGVLPIAREDILEAGYEMMGTLVREKVPPKPSTRITAPMKSAVTTRSLTRSDTRNWAKRVKGDLDWITMRALEKERDRRYGSAADLAADIARHLDHKAVSAGPPSQWYVARKFFKRNRSGVLLAATCVLALAVVAVWQSVQSEIIARQRDQAMAKERLSLARGHLAKDPTASLAYALSSLEVMDSPAARSVVRQAIARGPIRDEFPRWGRRGNPVSVDASADGRICAVAWTQTEHPTVVIYDLDDLSMRALEAPTVGIVYEVAFNADASFVLGLGSDGLHVWRVEEGEHLFRIETGFSSDFGQIHALKDPLQVAISEGRVAAPTRWLRLDLQSSEVTEIGRTRGSANDTWLYHVPAVDPSATVFLDYNGRDILMQRAEDLESGRTTHVGRHEAGICAVALCPAGETAVSIDVTGIVNVWDLRQSPPRLREWHQEPEGKYSLKFDPHGARFASAWGSPTMHIYDLEEIPRLEPRPLLDRTHWAHDGAFLPDGSVISGRNGIGVARWRFGTPFPGRESRAGFPVRGYHGEFTGDGRDFYGWAATGEIVRTRLDDGDGDRIELVGRTTGWDWGTISGFVLDRNGGYALAYGSRGRTAEIIDLATGSSSPVPCVAARHDPVDVCGESRLACFIDLTDRSRFLVIDLADSNVVAAIKSPLTKIAMLRFARGSRLLALGESMLLGYSLDYPEAAPDTLWTGDASRGGWILAGGESIACRGADLNLMVHDLQKEQPIDLGPVTERSINFAIFQPRLRLLAVGGWFPTIYVYNLESGERWYLPAPGEGRATTQKAAFDPLGRWLLTKHLDETVYWHLPLDALYGEIPHDRLLTRLRSLTNVRVIPDEIATEGFRITNTAQE
jgi:serine/threonine protein kinase